MINRSDTFLSLPTILHNQYFLFVQVHYIEAEGLEVLHDGSNFTVKSHLC